MTYYFGRSLRFMSLIATVSALSLSACATKPDRDRPPRGEGSQDRPARTSGTFLRPAALLFADMDANQDKLTTKAEMEAGVETEWVRFGQRPGATAFAAWSLRNLGSTDATPTFMSFDSDFNGVVTKTEFEVEFDKLFKQFDRNMDSSLDRSEMIIAFEAPIGRSQKGGSAQNRGQGERGGRGGGRPPR